MDILGTEYFSSKTKNGHSIHLYRRKDYPVYARISFRKGSRFDQPEKAGLAHFYEHLVLTGTKRFPTKDKLAEEIERYGGTIHASTSKENININLTVAEPADFSHIIEIYRSLLSEPLFDRQIFQKEKEVVISEIMNREQNSALASIDLYASICYRDTPLARTIGGKENTIASITIEDILNFHKEIISTSANIIISGGVEMDQITPIFEILGPITPVQNDRVETKYDRGDISVKRTDEQMIQMVLGYKTIPISHPDFYSLEIISDVVGGGRSSLLQKRLRYENGLVYGVSASQSVFSDTGSWHINTSTHKKFLSTVLNHIDNLMETISRDGLSTNEVEMSKNKLLKSKRIQLQTSASWADFHSYKTDLNNETDSCFNYLTNLQKTTLEEINRTIRKFFGKNNRYLALVGDVSEKEI